MTASNANGKRFRIKPFIDRFIEVFIFDSLVKGLASIRGGVSPIARFTIVFDNACQERARVGLDTIVLKESIVSQYPETSQSLILRVRDPSNQAAWDRFEQLYRPVIFRIARAKGLQHCDALDLVQQVLVSVAAAIGQYENQSTGIPFRNWLNRITGNAIVKQLSRGPKDRAVGGEATLDILSEISSDDPTDAMIELEYRREVYARAASRVRAEVQDVTWLAFEITVLQELPIQVAAKRLDLSTGSIYAARSRIMRRLQTAVNELEASTSETLKWEQRND